MTKHHFSRGSCNTQEKWMQKFRGQIRCIIGDEQVVYNKLNTDYTCLGLQANSTSANMKRWTNGWISQPKVMGCMDNPYFLPLVPHWVYFRTLKSSTTVIKLPLWGSEDFTYQAAEKENCLVLKWERKCCLVWSVLVMLVFLWVYQFVVAEQELAEELKKKN